MPRLWLWLMILPLWAPLAARAQLPVVISSGPDKVAVTLYRDPERGEAPLDRDEPGAFALIAETRTVMLPPGEAVIRFEGVASGIVPQSAILFGAPPRERNRDAALLSQKGLVDAFTGQRVILRRTDPASGRTVEESATVRSAADRLVVTTMRGVEALYCSGLHQTLLYPGAPATLSAKPVLTMTTRDQPGGPATITLAYIATGFDWDATYVGTLAPHGQSLDLLGWLTLASADDTSFADATASAIAGRVNRSEDSRDDSGERAREEARYLNRFSACWPAGTTSDLGSGTPPPPAPPPMAMMMAGEDIVVTAQRRQEGMLSAPAPVAVVARAENLGDLKLYRIPVPVTVAARAQKQVAFLVKQKVKGSLVYRTEMRWEEPDDPRMLFRFRNGRKDGLGDPLPAGRAVLYQDSPWGRMYVGESTTGDKTVDEEVEWSFAQASNLTLEPEQEEAGKGILHHNLVVRNANPFPIRFEIDFPANGGRLFSGFSGRLTKKPGKQVWAMTVPANGTIRLRFRSAGQPN
ncbi:MULTISPECIES: DUF4139 domain-containing protein [Sphingobium]|jgi:hypothetical protein|uniref:DUF4139 domain-containing protein n=2 Tax=Sphingobium fuliginis (strain ATCC 27551) TaxID=336203 RepID=A0A4Q4IUK7_SPHSA|nr:MULTISPECIES: hypothetical protein [Sphingobium]QOT73568.1 hypothetical protein H5V43_20385 [Sphingobium fuliginis]RYL97211.1 hypothetical protein EWH10_15290 [Sphingobium fuliginis]WDA35624.1 hypothetical protein PO876_19550 [Sphingobium sp. YC-XJ3]GFZ96463.1 hypothetical protein GCM10019071_28560 [Sphingobium fuliginis]